MHEARHYIGDSPQLQGVQAWQATDAARGTVHRDPREETENRTREEETTETPGQLAAALVCH